MPFFFSMVVILMIIFLSFSGVFYIKLVPKKQKARIPAIIGILLVDIGTLYFMVNGSSETDSFFYRACMFLVTVCFVANIYGAIFYAISLMIRLVLRIIKKTGSGVYEFLRSRALRIGVLVFTCVLAVVGYLNMSIVSVNDYKIYTDKLPEGKEYSFAVVTDMHMSTGVYANRIDDLFEKINDTGCDAVLFVGDIADNRSSEGAYAELKKALTTLNRPLGAFYVDGNHDDSGTEDMKKIMREAGVTVLSDEKYELVDGITLYGRDDPSSFRGRRTVIPNDLKEEEFNLIMTHQPINLAEFATAGGDLSVSGHTHGEQFPLMYPIIASSNDAVMGHTKIDDMDVVVSRGVGGWGLHFSLPSPKEIALVHVIGKH